LIHDDLPAMDDDDLRRGKPTNHKVFGEAMAILAGDGLLTKAFEAAALNAAELKLNGAAAAELVRLIAFGAGAEGMVGGQVADLAAEGASKKMSKTAAARMLEAVHRRKTGALIIASLDAGALLAGATQAKRESLRSYGECVGLAFQIADDVLDVVGDKKKLGKRGSDRDNDKLTYASLYGVDGARAKARALVEMAHAHLKAFGTRASVLHELADYIIERDK
jgi:geranylgeranyl diphosphate synthase type II